MVLGHPPSQKCGQITCTEDAAENDEADDERIQSNLPGTVFETYHG
jgi:hypothetical protein